MPFSLADFTTAEKKSETPRKTGFSLEDFSEPEIPKTKGFSLQDIQGPEENVIQFKEGPVTPSGLKLPFGEATFSPAFQQKLEETQREIERPETPEPFPNVGERLQKEVRELLPLQNAPEAFDEGFRQGKALLGDNYLGKTVGAPLAAIGVVGTIFNPVVYSGRKAVQLTYGLGQALKGDVEGASATIEGVEEILPQLQPSMSKSTIKNFISDLLVSAAKDPFNTVLIADGVAQLGATGYALRAARLGKPLPAVVAKNFPEAQRAYDENRKITLEKPEAVPEVPVTEIARPREVVVPEEVAPLVARAPEEIRIVEDLPKEEAVKPTELKTAEELADAIERRAEPVVEAAPVAPVEIKAFTDDLAFNARERIAARRKEGRVFAGLDPTEFADYVIIGTNYAERGFRTFATWSAEMVREFGETIKPHLENIWKDAESNYKAISLRPREEAVPSEVARPAEALVPESRPVELREDQAKIITEIQKDLSRSEDLIVDLPKKEIQALKPEAESFNIPEETLTDWVQRKFQDRMNRLGIIQKEIAKGRPISESQDAFLAQKLYPGRSGDRIELLETDVVLPLLKRMKDEGLTMDELADYMYAKHAPSRNSRLQELTGKDVDGLSGMKNSEATEILNKFTQENKIEKLQVFEREFRDKVIDERLRLAEKEGLISPEGAEAVRKTFDDGTYVPLKSVEKTKGLASIIRGKGFTVRGKEIQRLKGGSLTKRNNPFIQSIVDLESTIIRSEKNIVDNAFLDLVLQNPNEKLWKVEIREPKRIVDPETGEFLPQDPKVRPAENVLQLKRGGKDVFIEIKDEALAKAMTNMGSVGNSFKALVVAHNYLRAINTTFYPEFVITNLSRDIQQAMINISGEQSVAMATKTAKDIPSAIKGVWENVRGNKATEWAKLYEEMKSEGGRVGWFDFKTIDEKAADLVKTIKRYNSDKTLDRVANVIDKVGEYVVDMNEAVESGTRLSFYKQLRESGVTPKRAASMAKELTLDFNKKGEWGTALNSLYLFYNAGVQGSARILTALKNPRVQKIGVGIAAFSYALNEMNSMVNEEVYDKIPDDVKNRNLIFMFPSGNYMKIPLPYGYNVFKNLGDLSYEAAHGKKTIPELSKNFVLSLDSSFNPLSSSTITQFLSPTILDPIVQQAENKNFWGGPVVPEQFTFGPQKKQSDLYFNSTTKPSKEVADFINSVTGGSKKEAGAIDISPAIIDHYVNFLTGGTGRFLKNVLSAGMGVAEGELPEIKNTPFLRTLIGTPTDSQDNKIVFETLKKSAITLFDDRQREQFTTSLISVTEKDKMDSKSALKKLNSFIDNQAQVLAARELGDEATDEEIKRKSREYVFQIRRDMDYASISLKLRILASKNPVND